MNCGTCKHVLLSDLVNEGETQPRFGFCRRFPPLALSQTGSTFPIVQRENMICGEYVANRTAPPTPKRVARGKSK